MASINDFYSELYRRYGNVKRARNCFFYTEKGVRLTDLYQENGRAILGWGGSQYTIFKNVINRGINGGFRTIFSFQLDKASGMLLGGKRKVFAFGSRKEAEDAGKSISSGSFVWWKPFSGIETENVDSVAFVPAFGWSENIFLLAVKDFPGKDLYKEITGKGFNPLLLPSPLQAGISRGIYDLIQAEKVREEKDFFLYDKALSKYFVRKGPWLTPKVPEEKYDAFVLHMLDCKIVINPEYGQSLVPFGAEPGVFSELVKKPFDF